jgi:NADPH-dependent curcumin reductase CurA
VQLGEVMVGQTVGEVLESRDPRYRPGDTVLTPLGWQLYGIAKADAVSTVDARRAPASYYLGILGMPGITAWIGVNEIAKVQAPETVVVSAASGAVGSVAGQLAKIAGCRVIGIAGGRAKCDYVVTSLGFDACIDRKVDGWQDALRAACPDGADVDFENVGGAVLDAVLGLMNTASRVVLCGLIAEYNAREPYGHNLRSVLVKRIRMQGMIVFDWKHRYAEAVDALRPHLDAGRLHYRESIVEGLDNAPRGLIALLNGENFGKQVVKLV